MTDARSGHVMLLNVERVIMMELDLEEMIDKFRDRRMPL
jgi:hypothetical protein